MSFSVRAYLAAQMGCSEDDLIWTAEPRTRTDGTWAATYARRPSTSPAAHVVIGPPRQNLTGLRRRLVMTSWDKGNTSQTDIGPDDDIVW